MAVKYIKVLGLVGIALVAIFLGACSSHGPVVNQSGDLAGIDRVAVLPYENMAEIHGYDTAVRSPLSGRVFITGPVADEAERFLTEQLATRVRVNTALDILPSPDVTAALSDAIIKGQGRETRFLELLSQTGRRIGADAVLVGHVYRFRERVGGEFSAESPASVAFDVYLIDCRQERVLWSASYDHTQRALSEDVGDLQNFLRRGGRWVTAEALATAAMEEIFAEYPRR
jgi:hypothetical protein